MVKCVQLTLEIIFNVLFERPAPSARMNVPRPRPLIDKNDTITLRFVIASTVAARWPFTHVKTTALKQEHFG